MLPCLCVCDINLATHVIKLSPSCHVSLITHVFPTWAMWTFPVRQSFGLFRLCMNAASSYRQKWTTVLTFFVIHTSESRIQKGNVWFSYASGKVHWWPVAANRQLYFSASVVTDWDLNKQHGHFKCGTLRTLLAGESPVICNLVERIALIMRHCCCPFLFFFRALKFHSENNSFSLKSPKPRFHSFMSERIWIVSLLNSQRSQTDLKSSFLMLRIFPVGGFSWTSEPSFPSARVWGESRPNAHLMVASECQGGNKQVVSMLSAPPGLLHQIWSWMNAWTSSLFGVAAHRSRWEVFRAFERYQTFVWVKTVK